MALNIFNKSFGNNDIDDALPELNNDVTAVCEIANGDAEAQALANEIKSETEILNTSVEALESLQDLQTEHELKLQATELDRPITLDGEEIPPVHMDMIGVECFNIQKAVSSIEGILGAEKGSLVYDLGFGNNSFTGSKNIHDYRAGVEGIGDIIKKVKDKIVAFFKYIWDKIKQFWNWITGKKNEEKAEEAKKVVEEIKKAEKTPEGKEKVKEKIEEIANDDEKFQQVVEANIASKLDPEVVNDYAEMKAEQAKILNEIYEDVNKLSLPENVKKSIIEALDSGSLEEANEILNEVLAKIDEEKAKIDERLAKIENDENSKDTNTTESVNLPDSTETSDKNKENFNKILEIVNRKKAILKIVSNYYSRHISRKNAAKLGIKKEWCVNFTSVHDHSHDGKSERVFQLSEFSLNDVLLIEYKLSIKKSLEDNNYVGLRSILKYKGKVYVVGILYISLVEAKNEERIKFINNFKEEVVTYEVDTIFKNPRFGKVPDGFKKFEETCKKLSETASKSGSNVLSNHAFKWSVSEGSEIGRMVIESGKSNLIILKGLNAFKGIDVNSKEA